MTSENQRAVSSARNQFKGKIIKISKGAVNSEIILDIEGPRIVAIITNESVKNLDLREGGEATALIKASWVIVSKDLNIKSSARNKLSGQVAAIRPGAVNSEVIIELPGGQGLAAIITNESVKNLGLKEGDLACGLIKASQVIIAII